jgi:O-antigen/teichoic acid export membrane protein
MIDKQQLVKSGLWQILNVAAIFLSQVTFFYFMARLVSKEEFGIMAILLAIVNFASTVTEAGMGDALMQKKDMVDGHKNAALYFSVGMGLLFYIILYCMAPWIAREYKQPILEPTLRVLGWAFVLNSLSSSSINILQKKFAFKKTFLSDSISLIVSTIIGIILGYMGYGVWALVFQYLLYYAFKTILLWIQEPIPVRLGAKKRHYKELLNYGFGLTLVRLNVYAINYGVNLLVGRLVSLATLGVFERSDRLVIIPGRYLGDIVQKVNVPNMSKHQDDNDKLFTIFYRGLSLLNSLLIPISAYWAFFAKPIVLIVMGKNWLEAVVPMQILFISLPFRVSVRDSDALMRVKRMLYKNVYRKFQYLVLLCIAIYLGAHYAPALGIPALVGITAGITITTIQNYFSVLLTIHRRLFPERWKEIILRPFYSGALLTLYTVVPAFLIYLAINLVIKSEIYCFVIVTFLLAGFVLYAFIKKPKLLLKDIHALREELMKIIKNRGKRKKAINIAAESEIDVIEDRDDL